MTILSEELEKMKAELAAQEGKEDEGTEFEEQEEESDEEEIEAKEEPEEEKVKEEIKGEEKKLELDDAGYARLRREATAAKRQAEQFQKELEDLRNAREIPIDIMQEAPLPIEMQAVLEDHKMNRAEREFLMFESKAKQQHPEYGAVAAEYAAAMYQSFKVQNPRKTDVELNDMTKRAIFIKAGEFARAGYENPVEEMYHEARELGYTGKSLQKQESSKEEKLQPDMKKVSENRKRSSGMAANNGRQEGMMTLGAAADLSAAEWSRLPIADKRRLMYGQ